MAGFPLATRYKNRIGYRGEVTARPRSISAILATSCLCILLLAQPSLFAAEPITYRWRPSYYGELAGTRRLLHNDSLHFGKLTHGDLDGDGDLDILVGSEDGTISYFENLGRPGAPRMELRVESIRGIFPIRRDGKLKMVRRVLKVDGHAAPALVDIDRDGDLDLFVGSAKGKLYFFRNIGTATLPAFEMVTDQFITTAFGTYLTPFFSDVNGDRSPDMIVGNLQGDVYLMVNQGARKVAAFCVKFPNPNALPEDEPPCLPTPQLITSIAPESNAAPALTDYDQDGDLDLFVGKGNGAIAFYENHGDRYRFDWVLIQSRFLAIDDGGFAAPAFMDVNGDNLPELQVGSSTNAIPVYTGKDTGRPLDVWKMTRNFLSVDRLGGGRFRVVAAPGDVDDDGDTDLILGDRGGSLVWIENIGTKTNPAWRVKNNNLVPGSNRRNLAPLLADFDGDGDLDLIVGGRDGRLWFLANRGSAKKPRWRMTSNFYSNIDVGNSSIPATFDADGDGDLDLLVGNSQGLLIYYRNEGTAQRPDFKLASTKFAGVLAGKSAAPAIFDWNGDNKPDLLVGNRAGRIILVVRKGDGGPVEIEPRTWEIVDRRWERIEMKTHSVPRTADLNGDGKPDLLVTDGQGNLKLWYNGGFIVASADKGAAAKVEESAAQSEGQQGAPESEAPGAPSLTLAADEDEFESDGDSPLPALEVSSAASGQVEESLEIGADELEEDTTAQTGPIDPLFTLESKAFGKLKFDGRASPTFGDVDKDGDLDLIVGTGRGSLVLVLNKGTPKSPKWERVTDTFADYSHGRNPSPLLVDLDGDGTLELLVGTESGRVFLYTSQGGAEYTLSPDALITLKAKRNAAPAAISMGAGKGFNLLLGNLAGQILLYEQSGEAQSLNFKRVSRRFLGIDVGVSATPYIGDIDRDGSPDLLIGSDQGIVHHYQLASDGSKTWKKIDDDLKPLKFPAGTTPRLADIDGDGDQDLFVGSEKGVIYFYRNEAIP